MIGSPHFFADGQDFFCPTLEITHDGGSLSIDFDAEGLDRLLDVAFA